MENLYKKFSKLTEDKGAATVEFALVLIPLLLMIFGIIEFGLLVFNQQMITNASREGSRAGIVVHSPRLSEPEIRKIVKEYCSSHLVTFGTTTGPAVDFLTGPCNSFGDILKIKVEYQYNYLFLSNFGIGPKTLRAVSTMRCE